MDETGRGNREKNREKETKRGNREGENMSWNNCIIKEAWNRYIKGKEPIPDHVEGVRQEILESWRRSQGKSDPFARQAVSLSPEELSQVLAENALLIRIAYPYLIDFYKFLRKSHCQILLTDSRGRQLKCISGNEEHLTEMAERAQVTDGCIYSEETNGTNGVSLCLAEEKPILVFGAEHYRYMFQEFVCYGAPIHSPSGELLGCICIMGSIETYQPGMLNTLRMAVSGIEKEFRLTQANQILTSILDMFNKGVLFTDPEHRVIQYNELAVKILRLDQIRQGDRLEDLIQAESVPLPARDLKTEISSMGCTLLNRKREPIHVNLTVRPPSPGSGQDASLLLLETQEAGYELTSRMAGYSARYTFDSIIGVSEEMKRVRTLGLTAADSVSNVLVFGESGTGKELMAQAIHNAGSRADGPFVAINCGSIPKNMIETELFGYEGGSFSGDGLHYSEQGERKNGNPGKFELAGGGTLFLDEIGSMSLEGQAALLRVLQTHEITRLGGKVPKTVDVRIIAATNIDLFSAVQNKTFRNDLYYRLNVFNIVIPPLREHREDIMPLAEHFLKVYAKQMHKEISGFDSESAEALLSYDWPGNVRELENIVERTVNISKDSLIHLSVLPGEVVNSYFTARYLSRVKKKESMPDRVPPDVLHGTDQVLSPEIMEYNRIIEALKKSCGYTKAVAVMLDMPLSTLYRKLQKYGLNPKDYRIWKEADK